MNTDHRYDFDRVISRINTDCAKWDLSEGLFGDKDILPMWVADMDFGIASEITDAIRKRAAHEIYGYTVPGSSVKESVVNRMKQKYAWKIKPEWVVFTPGVVPALYAAVKAFTHPGDEVALQGPVYSPFWSAIKDNGCQLINNQLKLHDGRYEMDFEDLEAQFQFRKNQGIVPVPSRLKMMILCSPHNPVGRVWNRKELTRIGEMIVKHNAVIISDEIHAEVLYKGVSHIPFASISAEFAQHSLTCISPSKAFNLAGLGTSAIIIPNAKLRDDFNTAKYGIMSMVNCFGLTSLSAAYNDGDGWLTQFLSYLQDNLEFLMTYFRKRIPMINVIKPEGTYLVWLDCRGLKMDNMALRDFVRKDAKLGLEDGFTFGAGGDGFQRMNIACPRKTLINALGRLEDAVNMHYSSGTS